MGGRSERTQGQAIGIPLLPKATFTPSIQPNLGLPRTRSPLTSALLPQFLKEHSHNSICSLYNRDMLITMLKKRVTCRERLLVAEV